jgi:phage shock protein A
MERKVDEIEASAEAIKELDEASTGASLDKQFAQLESSPQAADALLEELKKKMLTEDAGRAGAQQ